MAATIDSYGCDRVGFVVNAYCADWSGCEEIIAAVAGKSIYIERLYISNETAVTITIGAGETGGAVTNELLGPLYVAANGFLAFDFSSRPLKVTAATALVADASAGTDFTVIVHGYVK